MEELSKPNLSMWRVTLIPRAKVPRAGPEDLRENIEALAMEKRRINLDFSRDRYRSKAPSTHRSWSGGWAGADHLRPSR